MTDFCPINDLSRYQNVLLFGGSFDPPHHGHLTLPHLAMKAIGADVLAYIPCATNPFKQDKKQTPVHHRLAMLKLAIRGLTHTTILTDEIDRSCENLPSYTIDTLIALKRKYPKMIQWRWLMGTDQALQFDQWRAAKEVEQIAEPVVMVRSPTTRQTLLAKLDESRWASRLINVPKVNVSSTMIRQQITQGKPIDHYMPAQVVNYIKKHQLYRQPE